MDLNFPYSLILELKQVSVIVLFIALLTASVTAATLVIQSKRVGLSEFQGPWLAQYTDAWSLWATRKIGSSDVKVNRVLQAKYGDVVRTGPKTLTVFDPNVVPLLYGVRARLEKGDAYIPFRQPGVQTNLVAIRDEGTHSKYKKLVANAYSMASIKGYETFVDGVIDRLLEVFDRHAQTGEPMNLSLWLRYYSFEAIYKLSTGEDLGLLDGKGSDPLGLVNFIRSYGQYIAWVSHMPSVHKIWRESFLAKKSKPPPFLRNLSNTVDKRLCKESPTYGVGPDILSHLVATHTNDPDLMTGQRIKIATAGNFVAGSVSPALVLEAIFRYLVGNPDIQDKLYAEIAQAKVSTSKLSYENVRNLTYFDAFMQESFRLYSPSAFNLQRVAGPKGLDLPDGRHVPAGVNIGCSSGMVNRAVSVYGSDAENFRPERWLLAKDESADAYEQRRKLMDRTELSFGQGSRACIGKNIALMEIYKVVAATIYAFKFEPAEGTSKEDVFATIRPRTKA